MSAAGERILFVTGKLAEPALRKQLTALETAHGIRPEVAVLPITVAALLTTPWVANHLTPHSGVQRVVLSGYCSGELSAVERVMSVPVERGPKDLRDLPEHFGETRRRSWTHSTLKSSPRSITRRG